MQQENSTRCSSTSSAGPNLFRPYRWWHSGKALSGASQPERRCRSRSRFAARLRTTSIVRRVAAFQRAIIDDPPAIFLAWSERARAVSRDSTCRRRAGPRHPEHAAPLAPAADAEYGEPELTCGSATSRHRFALLLGGGRGRAAARLRRRLPPLAPARHARIGHQGQPERRHARRRGNPPLRHHQRRTAQGASPPTSRTPASTSAAGPDPQELRPPVPRVPRDHAVRRDGRDRRHQPRRQAAGRDPDRRAADHQRRPHVADPRRRGPAADHDVRHPSEAPEPAGRLARRRVQPRGNVADGRPDPHRRARLRHGRRARRQADRARRSRQEGAGGADAAT